MAILSVQNIHKQYQNHTALQNISFDIEKGEIFGLLGPNGAGKTTLIRIINQIIIQDQGHILLNNAPISSANAASIGYLPEERGLYKKMKVGEQVLYLSQLKGLSKADATTSAKAWFEKFEIQDWWNKKIEELSKGMQQKVQFITAVMHNPMLLILDEPFSGFDPVNSNIIKNEILELQKKGTTIMLSTHRMENVEELCDSIVMINKSQMVLKGKVQEIRTTNKPNEWIVQYKGDLPELPDHIKLVAFKEDDFAKTATLALPETISPNQLMAILLPAIQLIGFKEKLPSMADIFIKNVKESNNA